MNANTIRNRFNRLSENLRKHPKRVDRKFIKERKEKRDQIEKDKSSQTDEPATKPEAPKVPKATEPDKKPDTNPTNTSDNEPATQPESTPELKQISEEKVEKLTAKLTGDMLTDAGSNREKRKLLAEEFREKHADVPGDQMDAIIREAKNRRKAFKAAEKEEATA